MPSKEAILKKRDKRRMFTAVILVVLSFVLFFSRLFELQYLKAATYTAQGSGISTIKAPIKASRGEILDYYGRPLATNRAGYNLAFNYASINKNTLNDVIVVLMQLLQNNQSWADDLPLNKQSPYGFTETADSDATKKLLKNLNLAHYATAENCFSAMVELYQLQGYSTEQQRRIMGVRYTMDRAGFSITAPYTFAEDVSSEVMTVVSENQYFAENGVTVEIASFREYSADSVAPHIIGNVGPIYADDWETYKEKGYSYNDKVGKSGIEKAEEEYLRGQDGEITYRVNAKGKILSSTVTKQPVQGNTVRLTLDKTVQMAAQNALKSTVEQLKKDGINASAGTAVAVNVKTFGIIAAANYPSYTYKDYKENYQKLANDKTGKPLFNRAFNGTYPPASTFKPAVACAALQLGVITPQETIICRHTYTYYKDTKPPHCMGTHGAITLNRALAKSCNYYFFDVGRRLGIDNMNKYCRMLGLGEYTGVEIDESKGILAGPSSREKWYAGYTLSAAIGQSDNSFTPLQMACYAATIANGGTRYKATLIDKITAYGQNTTVLKNQAKVLNKAELSQSVINTVKEGMLSVTEDGTGSRIFSNYPIKVGGKTGTAENSGKDHTVFIAFAPYDNPEIAVSVIIEHGEYGTYSGNVLKSIFNAYFFTELNKYSDTPSYKIIP